MSTFLKLAALGVVAAGAAAATYTAKRVKEIKQHNFKLPKGFTVTAHTGCDGTPDNSIASIKRSIDLGVDVAENDLTLRLDGTPVLMHSPSAIDDDGLPFEDALKFVSENSDTIMLNIDLKAFNNLPKIQDMIEKYSLSERCFFTGVEECDTQGVKIDAPDIPFYLNIDLDKFKLNDEDYIMSIVHKVSQSCAVGINCEYHNTSKKLVEIMHREGFKVSFWTVDNKTAMEYVLSTEPDNITTREPELLMSIIGEKNEK